MYDFIRSKKNIDIKQPAQIIMILICILLFCLCVFKTINVAISGDEVHSYFTYMLNWSFSQGIKPDSANNHLLNTFLGWLNLTIFDGILKLHVLYNVFLIRLHILFFYAIFLVYSIKTTKFFRFRFLPFSLLLSCYYVHNYFSLARGYAIAASLVLAGSYYYLQWMRSCNNKNLTLAYCFYIAACYGNSIALLCFASLLIDSSYRLIKKKLLLNYIKHTHVLLPIFIFLTCYIIYYHFSNLKIDIPLHRIFSYYESTMTIPFFSEYARWYFLEQKPCQFIIIFLLLTFMCISALKYFQKLKTMPFFCIFLYFIGISVFSKILFHAYLPSHRALIPSLPLLVFAISELSDRRSKIYTYKRIHVFGRGGVLAILWLSFLINYDGYKDIDWSNSYQMRDKIYQAYNEGRQIDYIDYAGANAPFTFYAGKILYEHNIGSMRHTTFPALKGEELKIAGNNEYLYSWGASRNKDGYFAKDEIDGPLVLSKQYIANSGTYKAYVTLDFPDGYKINSGYVRVDLGSNWGAKVHAQITVKSDTPTICLDNIIFYEHTANVMLSIYTDIPNLVFKDCTIIRTN